MIKQSGPITSSAIAGRLNLSRAALRSDLAILTTSGLAEAKPKVGYYFTGKNPKMISPALFDDLKIQAIQSPPIVIRGTKSVYEAIVTMFREDVGTIFVVSDADGLEGVLSRKDLIKAAMGNHNITELPVSVAMTRMPNIIFTTPDETVLAAAKKLLKHQIDALPVVITTTGINGPVHQVVGRFTKTNLTRLFVQLAEE